MVLGGGAKDPSVRWGGWESQILALRFNGFAFAVVTLVNRLYVKMPKMTWSVAFLCPSTSQQLLALQGVCLGQCHGLLERVRVLSVSHHVSSSSPETASVVAELLQN